MSCLQAFEPLGRYTYNCDRHAVHIKRSSQNVRTLSESSIPIVKADDCNGSMFSFVLLGETMTARKLHSKTGEERSADHVALGLLGLRSIAYRHLTRGEWDICHHLRQRAMLFAESVINRIRESLTRVDRASPFGRARR